MSTSKIDLAVLNTGKYEKPVFKERKQDKWVRYGEDDKYATYLEELYYTSSIHNAIINGVTDMIRGDGPYAQDWEQNDATKESWLRLNDLFGEELLYKTALDLKLYGQFYWCVIWNQARTKVAAVEHAPARSFRAGICNHDGYVDKYYYKYDWEDKQETPQVYKCFDMNDRTSPKVVLHVKRHSPSYNYYGVPDYIGSTNFIELDRQIGSFHLNNVKNGMFPGWAIHFRNGVPTDEERDEIERKINAKFSGPEAAGNIIITFNDGADTTPEMQALESNGNSEMFQYLSGELNNKILSGHRVTSPLLFGVRGDGGGFGNNADELRDSYSLFHTTVIQPFQRMITDAVNEILSVSQQPLNIEIGATAPADFLNLAGGKGSQAYTGIQVSSAMEIYTKVMSGELTKEAGITFLVQTLSFPHEVASALFEPTESAQEKMCSHTHHHFSAEISDYFMDCAEDMGDQYELCDQRHVNYEMEAARDALWTFARQVPKGKNEPGRGKEDNDIVKIRYAYVPARAYRNKKYDSRDFCDRMEAASAAGKVWKKEDIIAAEQLSVNPGFGEDGAATYDIWKFKGGPWCRHVWERRTYLQKDNSRVSVAEARRLINQLDPDDREGNRIESNPFEVSQAPRSMDNNGFK